MRRETPDLSCVPVVGPLWSVSVLLQYCGVVRRMLLFFIRYIASDIIVLVNHERIICFVDTHYIEDEGREAR